MARMPGAQWRPVSNRTVGGQTSIRGVVLHIMEGTLDGSDSWFRNPAAQASAHFGVGKDGRIFQWVDTADRAWAQADGNRTWLSIEHEGHAGDSLTPAQLAATASVVAWMHRTHGVPLQSTDSTSGTGIGWHGMGGAAWGGHTGCPGTPIKDQRAAIIKAASPAPSKPSKPTKPTTPKLAVSLANLVAAAKADPRAAQGRTTHAADVRILEAALRAEGLLASTYAADGSYGTTTVTAYAAWQRKCGYTGSAADGIPGSATLTKLGAKHGFTVKG